MPLPYKVVEGRGGDEEMRVRRKGGKKEVGEEVGGRRGGRRGRREEGNEGRSNLNGWFGPDGSFFLCWTFLGHFVLPCCIPTMPNSATMTLPVMPNLASDS